MQDLDAELKRLCEQTIADVARSVADAASGVLARVRRDAIAALARRTTTLTRLGDAIEAAMMHCQAQAFRVRRSDDPQAAKQRLRDQPFANAGEAAALRGRCGSVNVALTCLRSTLCLGALG